MKTILVVGSEPNYSLTFAAKFLEWQMSTADIDESKKPFQRKTPDTKQIFSDIIGPLLCDNKYFRTTVLYSYREGETI